MYVYNNALSIVIDMLDMLDIHVHVLQYRYIGPAKSL